METVCVNIAEFEIVNNPKVIETRSLGSCVAIVLYDVSTRTTGLAHIMLPDSKKVNVGGKPGKYVDVAITTMLNRMLALGINKVNIVAKIAGGACMFSGLSVSDFMNIGLRNVSAIKTVLKELGIKLVAEDTGGSYGRTVEFHTDSGKLIVKSTMAPTKEI
jgi:chemotaxis protein CheD